jgi:hypothetical protein
MMDEIEGYRRPSHRQCSAIEWPVQTSRKKVGHHEINKGSDSKCSEEEDIKGDLGEEVVDRTKPGLRA